MFENIPKEILEILKKINISGYEAFIVGGCVRDILLSRKPNDYDITTNASPDNIKKIFKDYKTVLVGEQFGTVLVLYKGYGVEITTYRIESNYLDGRRPEIVKYTNNLKKDLSRRDFTINAMAYNKEQGLIDYFNGLDDLNNKLIKTVGNPDTRFIEDHLRILRAIRFSTQLNFKIDKETYDSCLKNKDYLSKISFERIRDEIFKILLSDKPSEGIRLMEKMEILEIVLPEIIDTIGFEQRSKYHDKDVYNHTLCVLDNVSNKIELRLAALLHDIAKPETFTIDDKGDGHFYGHEERSAIISKKILRRLNVKKILIEDVALLIREHMKPIECMSKKGIRRLISRVGKDKIFTLYELQVCDKICTYKDRNIKPLLDKKEEIIEVLEEKNIYKKDDLEINGYDIIKLGYSEGKIVGEILSYLFDKVIDDPELNKKEILLELVKDKYIKED